MTMEMKSKSHVDEALAVDAHYSSYQIEFSPDEALEFARLAPAVGKVTPDRLVALIKRINRILPHSPKGRMFHKFRIGREENRFIGVPQTVADLSLERGRLLSIRLFTGDLPLEYRSIEGFSALTSKIVAMESEFRCSRCSSESGCDAEGDLEEIKFFWK